MGNLDPLAFAAAFARARWGYQFKSRDALLRYQGERLARFMHKDAPRCSFYRDRQHLSFQQLPVVTKAEVLAAFADFNSEAIEFSAAQAVALRAERDRNFAPTLPGGITVGSSSGTSGRPSVFLVSKLERSIWAGTMLARMLSASMLSRILTPWSAPVRIGFFLRANSNLYTSVDSRRVRFEFFDLLIPVEQHAEALTRYAPDILVAPASILTHLATLQQAGQIAVKPAQVISVAETLEAADAQSVLAAWQVKPRQIYQCTEGFLGYSCDRGSLHLNEEFVHFEPQWLDSARRRFVATVTDFSRTTQMFVRFRMDDILHVDAEPCECGRVTMRIKSIEGRQDDVLWLPDAHGAGLRPVFPDQVRRVMMLALPGSADYRLRQRVGAMEVSFADESMVGAAQIANINAEFSQMCRQLKIEPPRITQAAWITPGAAEKRRRIVRL
jgi:putative adenylate-forming enzyme